MKILRLIPVVGLPLGMAACVAVDRQDSTSTWPTEVRSLDEHQFTGLFKNQSASDPELYAPGHSYQLFDYLANQGRFKGHRGKYVRIGFSSVKNALEITLLDEGRRKIDFASLEKDKDYTFDEGSIRMKGSRTESGNVGGGFERFDFKLSANSSNGLLGKNSTSSAALLFYFLPIAGSGTDWLHWPRISN